MKAELKNMDSGETKNIELSVEKIVKNIEGIL